MSIISTVEALSCSISHVPTGSVSNPTEIIVGNIDFNNTFVIEDVNKHIVINGNHTATFRSAPISISLYPVNSVSCFYTALLGSTNSDLPLLVIDGVHKEVVKISKNRYNNDLVLRFKTPTNQNNQNPSPEFGYFESLDIYNSNDTLTYIKIGSILVFRYQWIEAKYKVANIVSNSDGSTTISFDTVGETDNDDLRFVYNNIYNWKEPEDDYYSSTTIEIINPNIQDDDIPEDTYVINYDTNGQQSIKYRSATGYSSIQATCYYGLNTLIKLKNCSNIKFENIKFTCNSIRKIAHHTYHIQADEDSKPCVHLRKCNGITFNGCEFSQINGYCIGVNGITCNQGVFYVDENDACQNITIKNCYIHDTLGGGFHLNNCHHSLVENNLIKNFGMMQHEAVGVLLRRACHHNTVTHNSIYNGPYTGISVGWSWRKNQEDNTEDDNSTHNTIAFNHIHHCMKVMYDGGGIYHLGFGAGTRIFNNVIHNIGYSINGSGNSVSVSPSRYAIYFDETSSGVECCENVCYRVETFMNLHDTGYLFVHDNVFAYCKICAFFIGSPDSLNIGEVSFHARNNIIRMDNGGLCYLIPSDRKDYLFVRNLIDDRGNSVRAFPKDETKSFDWYYGSMDKLFGQEYSKFYTTNKSIVPNPNCTFQSVNVNNFRLFGSGYRDFELITPLQGSDRYGIDNANYFIQSNLCETENELGW